jgi:hypothetical protein
MFATSGPQIYMLREWVTAFDQGRYIEQAALPVLVILMAILFVFYLLYYRFKNDPFR